jgi:hypothetical protein
MEINRKYRTITIGLTTDEYFDVQAKNTVGGIFDIIRPGGKIEVTSLSNIQEDNSLNGSLDDDKIIPGTSKAILRQDGSLQILLSRRDLTNTDATISRKSVETPGAKDKNFVRKNIPGEGIVVNFGTHLK